MQKIIPTLIVCLTIMWCFFAGINTDKTEHSISVQGDGEVYVTPDTLILSFRVEETAPTTAEAQKNANEKIDQVKEIIKQYDVDATDIKTTNVNVYEQYDWRESGRTSLWYTASHSLEVKIRKANIENEGIASRIIAQVSEIGGVLLNNISYDIYDKTPFYQEARKLAMEKAHQKAADLAEYGDVKLGKPLSIAESRGYDYAVRYANTSMAKLTYADEELAMDEAEVWWAIELWEMKLTLNVSVVYEIQ